MKSSETIRLDDGREFTMRALRKDDLDALERAFARLTADEIRFRLLEYARELPRSIVAQVRKLDPERLVAFVIDDGGEIRAVADLHIEPPDAHEAEFGLIVGKAVSGLGLGRRLMARLLAEAHRRGITAVTGCVSAENARMLRLCRDLGGSIIPFATDLSLKTARFKP
ncbi:MAG: GNAT family N-acetyltransferase [Rhodanobacteraceae bacterium]